MTTTEILELTKEINKLKTLRNLLHKGNKAQRRFDLQIKINALENLKCQA